MPRGYLINMTDVEILRKYNSEISGLYNYRKADVSHTVTLEYDDTGIQESSTNLIIQNERQKATLTVCAEDSETAMKLTGGSYTLYAGRISYLLMWRIHP